MTRIFTDGAEFGDMHFWDYDAGYTSGANTSSRSGNYCYFSQTYGVGTLVFKKSFSSLTELYYRMAHKMNDGSTQNFFSFYNGSNIIIHFRWDSSTLKIGAYVSGSLMGTSTNNFYAYNWNLIETHIKIADSPSGIVQLKVDGNLEIDWSGDTLYYYSSLDGVGINARCYLDDVALNDTNGSYDNSWCGDGSVYIITPSGSGTTNDWLNSGSTSGSSNYTYVDAFPYNSGSYVYCSGSLSGTQDQYKMTSFTIPHRNIRRIFPEARAKKSIADPTTMKLGYLPSGWTDQISGSLTLSTSYTRVVGDEAIINPATSASWTKADIDALEFIVEI